MKYLSILRPLTLLLLGALLSACQGDRSEATSETLQARLERQLAAAEAGALIELPAGRFEIDRELSLAVEGLSLVGAGRDRTILSFGQQSEGEAGVKLMAASVRLADLGIENPPVRGVLVDGQTQAVIHNVGVRWTDAAADQSFGIEARGAHRLLIENTQVEGAGRAGIRIGQSREVVVRNSRSHDSLVGIEIENSQRTDVYGSVASGNTTGILVVNSPTLAMSGYATRLFENEVVANNRSNTAAENSPLASLWRGTGIQIEGSDAAEIFNNRLVDNDTADLLVRASSMPPHTSDSRALDPYPESIFIHGNLYRGGGTRPEGLKLKWLRWRHVGLGERLPAILWDGRQDSAKQVNGQTPRHLRLCIAEGEARVMNLDLANDFANVRVEPQRHYCRLPSLPEVRLGLPAELASN